MLLNVVARLCLPVRRRIVAGLSGSAVPMLRRRVVPIIALLMLRIDEIWSRFEGSCRRRCSGKWRI
jgi:hypothetical protein